MSQIAGNLEPYLVLSGMLFAIGSFGFLARRNAITMLMSIELMLNAVNLSFVAFAKLHNVTGQVFVVMVMTIAAAEAAVGLAILISVFRHFGTVDLSSIRTLRG